MQYRKLKQHTTITAMRMMAVVMVLYAGCLRTAAQQPEYGNGKAAPEPRHYATADSTHYDGAISGDSIAMVLSMADSLMAGNAGNIESRLPVQADSASATKPRTDWTTWRPKPQRALWLALVFPGGGQIYNRKYWKLPIIYGGFVGCLYAMNWNNMMYKDYSQAYLDIMDDDPNTQSYNKFLHLGKQINSQNEERYKQIFKSRKDKYRRWRDLSFFCMIGVYALSVIDAYVDAELSEFDISKDLSLRVEPAVINQGPKQNMLETSALGVNCRLRF